MREPITRAAALAALRMKLRRFRVVQGRAEVAMGLSFLEGNLALGASLATWAQGRCRRVGPHNKKDAPPRHPPPCGLLGR